MFNPSLSKLYWKFLTLIVLIGCLGFLSSDNVPVVEASTCDSNFAQDVYACTDRQPIREGATAYTCNQNPGQYECCYNTYVNGYNLCVLQNGPIGRTPLAPMSVPEPDPDAEDPSLIEQLVRSCRMFGTVHSFARARYDDCIADGGTQDVCCVTSFAPLQ